MSISMNLDFSAHAPTIDTRWYDSEEIDALLAILWANLHQKDSARAERFLIFRTTPLDHLYLSLRSDAGVATLQGMQDLELLYPDPAHRPNNQKPWDAYDHLIFPMSVAQNIQLESAQFGGHWNHYTLCVLTKSPIGGGYYSIYYQDSYGLHSMYLQPNSLTALSLESHVFTIFSAFLNLRGCFALPLDTSVIKRQQENANDCGAILVHNVAYLFNRWLSSDSPPEWLDFPFTARREHERLLQEKLPVVYGKLLVERQRHAVYVAAPQQTLLAEQQPCVIASQLVQQLPAIAPPIKIDALWQTQLNFLRKKRLDIEMTQTKDKIEVLGGDLQDIDQLAKSLSLNQSIVTARFCHLAQFENDFSGYMQARNEFLNELERHATMVFDLSSKAQNAFHGRKKPLPSSPLSAARLLPIDRQSLDASMLGCDPIQDQLENLQQKIILTPQDITSDCEEIISIADQIAQSVYVDSWMQKFHTVLHYLPQYIQVRNDFLRELSDIHRQKGQSFVTYTAW